MSTPNAERGPRSRNAAFLSSGTASKDSPLLSPHRTTSPHLYNVAASPKRREALLYHLLALPFALAAVVLAVLLMWGIWAVAS